MFKVPPILSYLSASLFFLYNTLVPNFAFAGNAFKYDTIVIQSHKYREGNVNELYILFSVQTGDTISYFNGLIKNDNLEKFVCDEIAFERDYVFHNASGAVIHQDGQTYFLITRLKD